MIYAIVISLLVGAAATTFAEYKAKYNLFDYVLAFLGRAKAKEQAVVHEIKIVLTADTTAFHAELDKVAARIKEIMARGEKLL